MSNEADILRQLLTLKAATYERRSMAQLKAWVDGLSVHNPIDNECVPDFSCCNLGCVVEVPRPGQLPAYVNKPWLDGRLRSMFYRDASSRKLISQFILEQIEKHDPLQLIDVDLGDGVERVYARLK